LPLEGTQRGRSPRYGRKHKETVQKGDWPKGYFGGAFAGGGEPHVGESRHLMRRVATVLPQKGSEFKELLKEEQRFLLGGGDQGEGA